MKYLFLFLFSISLNAQKLKEYYFDINNNPITKLNYLKLIDHSVNLDVSKIDTAKIYKIVNRRDTGKLDSISHKNLIIHLSDSYGLNVDKNQFIVINYVSCYPFLGKRGKRSQWSIFNKNYIKDLNEKINCKQIWIYDAIQENLKSYSYKHIVWNKEKNNYIKNLFYPYDFNYGNTTIIAPSGEYFSYFGEYGPDSVFEGIDYLLTNK